MNGKIILVITVTMVVLLHNSSILRGQTENIPLDYSEKALLGIKVISKLDPDNNALLVTVRNDLPNEVKVNMLSIRFPVVGMSTGSFDKSLNSPPQVSQLALNDASLKAVVLNNAKVSTVETVARNLDSGQSISISYDLAVIKEKINDSVKGFPQGMNAAPVRINITFEDLLSPPLMGSSKETSSRTVTPFMNLKMK
jgi:hypothetical protein